MELPDRQAGVRALRTGSPVLPEPGPGIQHIIDSDPTPDLAIELIDSLQDLLGKLGDDELQQIAVAKMQGFENTEIAERLQMSKRTVARRMGLIRRIWEEAQHGE